MGSMSKTCLVFVVFVMTISDTITGKQDVITTAKGCHVGTVVNLRDCVDAFGNNVDMLDTEIIPSGTTCVLEHDGDQVFQITCHDGLYVIPVPEGAGLVEINRQYDIAKSRKVRSPLLIAGVVLGSLGILGSTLCFILCPKTDPNHPPTISSRAALISPSPIFAKKGTTSAKVSWELPSINDKEDGRIRVVASPSKYTSGGMFSEGNYNIYFVGTDSGGLTVFDFISFEVKVHRCGYQRWPENGDIDCERSDIIFGTKCKIRCMSGYSLPTEDSKSIECGEKGRWTSRVPDCKPSKCKPPPAIPNGKIQCFNNKYEYGSICEAVCIKGFQIRGMRLMGCDENGNWNSKPVCEDVLPPNFVHCPRDIQADIDSPDNTAVVTWTNPEGRDNSKQVPKITEVNGHKPGVRLKAGSHTVHYTIEDGHQNKGRPCIFNLKVLTVSCSPPDLDVHLKYDCPDSYRLGAECSLACKSGYPQAGATTIQCWRNTASYPPKLEWKWEESALKPFCKETNCSKDALKEPLNGALACSQWTHGQMCQMQCNAEYDIPNIGNGLFVCGKSDGKWRPSSYVPDCNQKYDVNNIRLPNEFYYYTGECNSSVENLNEIKENFVKALNTSNFQEACVGVPECQAKFVDVTCGPIRSRRKRDSYSHVKRNAVSKLAYIIQFDLILPYKQQSGKRADEIFAENKDTLYKMSDRIQAEADSGHFDINIEDLYVDSSSYGPGVPSLQCPAGMIQRVATGSCAGCPAGHYATEYGRCQECPFGTYQNSSNSMTCEACPPDTNTTETKSENITQCLDYCGAGEFSPTKLAPCTKCPDNSYQPNPKSVSCIGCERNKRTSGNGATSITQCQGYDVQLSAEGTKVENKATHDVVTVFMWLFIANNSTYSSIEIQNSSASSGLSLTFTPSLMIGQSGDVVTVELDFPSATWTSIALSVEQPSNEIRLYINGKLIYENSTFLATSSYVLEKNDVVEFLGDMKISAFSILPRKASPLEISSWSSTCSPLINGTVLSMDDLAEAVNVTIVVPSVCDAMDECTSSPCGIHECINHLDDYECLCSDGFTGRQCQIPPDFCENNDCKNGATCVNETTNYTCQCLYGFSGALCEIEAVDGQWSGWSNWAACSKSCDGGVATRVRRCDSPPPDPEGNNCTGNNSETILCNEIKCPECLKLRRTYGLTISCNETSTMQSCTISCRPGLFFASPQLPYYECGVATGYKWNHQNENNTQARLPSCSEMQPPRDISVQFDAVYDAIPCTTKNMRLVRASLDRKLSSLDCRQTSACQTTIKEPSCMNESGRKRSTGGTMIVTVGLGSRANRSEGHFSAFESRENATAPTQELITFVTHALELESSAQKLLNDSVEFFQVTVDGTNYTLADGSSGLTHKPTTTCPSGYVFIDVFCVESPVGSYSDGKMVTMCPIGQYQDRKGQSTCKQCSKGMTTDGIGSINVSECSVTEERPENGVKNDVTSATDGGVLIGVCVAVSVLILLAVAITIVCKYSRKRRHDSSKTDPNEVRLLQLSS